MFIGYLVFTLDIVFPFRFDYIAFMLNEQNLS